MVDHYLKDHPDFPYKVSSTIIATTDGAYQPALDQALQAGGDDQPDMYCAESAFVLKYTKGDMQDYAMPYKDLGIDVDKALKDADIAQYTIDIGTNTNGDLDALGYQATGGCFIYRMFSERTIRRKSPSSSAAAPVRSTNSGKQRRSSRTRATRSFRATAMYGTL